MEVKKRLRGVAQRLTPQIESMNVADEMLRMTARFEELLDYAEEKIQRTQDRVAAKLPSAGVRIDQERRERREEIQAIHDEENDELRADQEQSRAQPASYKPQRQAQEEGFAPPPRPSRKGTGAGAEAVADAQPKGDGAYFQPEPD